jgi:hypothetical protein
MPVPLSASESNIVNKDKAAVEALLGTPLKKSAWKNAPPANDADAAAVDALKAEMLDEIWIYEGGRVHFNMAGQAAKVDDKVGYDLPPDQSGSLIA